MGRVKRKNAFDNAHNEWIHIILHMRKASPGPLLFIETFYSIQWFFFCIQRRPWSDCAVAQSDLDLRCPHMPEETYSQGVAHIVINLTVLLISQPRSFSESIDTSSSSHIWAGPQHFMQDCMRVQRRPDQAAHQRSLSFRRAPRAQTDQCLRWVHMQSCRKCCAPADKGAVLGPASQETTLRKNTVTAASNSSDIIINDHPFSLYDLVTS